MAKKVAPPKSTGGGGFVFEDKVCAWFLAHMLAGEPPLDTTLGTLDRIDFQTRVDGWYLDDLLLTLSGPSGTRRCALSVKSNTQFGVATAPPDFVKAAWEQFLHEGSDVLNEAENYLGIATAPISGELRDAISFVIRTAREGDPPLLPGRYADPNWASETKRSLFESFTCPNDLAIGRGITSADTGRLTARLQVLEFDFEATVSESEKEAVQRCRRSLTSQSTEDALALWAELLRISATKRPVAGCVTRLTLLNELRGRFRLVDLPDHRADWRRLEHLSTTVHAQIRDSIGGQVRIPRDKDVAAVGEALHASPGVVLLGRSGIGKSVVAKILSDRNTSDGGRSLWFDARSFDRVDYAAFEADLALSHELPEVLRSAPNARPLLVLDGLDRLRDETAFGIVAFLVRGLGESRGESPWRVILTCQTPEWPRLQALLPRVDVPVNTWPLVECEPVSFDALEPVWEQIPSASRLRFQTNLQPLLVNLKILDLVATQILSGGSVVTSGWVGETSVARWFWDANVARGDDASPRARLVALLAERQADDLRPALPLHAFNVGELAPLDGLIRDGICQRSEDDRVAFQHDLFGDWARMRILASRHDDIESFLADRLDSPLWHRALRLYGIHLLEQTRDLARWRATLASLTGRAGSGAGDCLIDSLFFAANALPLLEAVRADLLAEDGKLLRRLLGRFLVFATLPDARVLAFAKAEELDSDEVAARYRRPNWTYWGPVLRFLFEHRQECIPCAPVEIARFVALLLDHAPAGIVLREEAATVGLMLGERAIAVRESYSSFDRDHRKDYYRVALAGAVEHPDDVSAFALRAAQRGPRPARAEAEESVGTLPKSIRFDPRFDHKEPMPEPWPDGPNEAVDDDFQSVALDATALLPLIRSRPQVAREVILACLIKAHRRFERSDHWHERSELDIDSGHKWHPPLYLHGPFLAFLNADFREGLETIARLVDFATQRWRHYTEVDSRESELERECDGSDGSRLGQMLGEWMHPPTSFVLPLASEERVLIGDARVYAWSAGLGNPPNAVEAALMALEQHLYLKLEGGHSIDEKLQDTLDRATSVAFLKVLCDVGKKEPVLFERALRPLLAVPEVYRWDLQATLHDRSHLMIGAWELQGRTFVRLAQAFHGMEHRSKDLREIAVRLFVLGREEIRDYLSSVRQRWETWSAANPTHPNKDFLEQLIVGFTIENYRAVEHPEHGKIIVNIRAHQMHAERAEERRRAEEQMFVTMLPVRCRKMIDEGSGLPGEELEAFWAAVQRIAAPQEYPPAAEVATDEVGLDVSQDREANALTGAAAVLIRLHRNWLQLHPDRLAWCREQLIQSVLNPPPRDMMDIPESIASETWDCFSAEALPVLWAADPNDAELRHLVARLVFAHHYAAVRILFSRCAEQRLALGRDFERLRRLAFECAHVRNRVTFVNQARQYIDALRDDVVRRFHEAVREWVAERIEAFVDGGLPEPTDDWRVMDDPQRFADIDAHRIRRYGPYYLDFQLIQAAHEWLPELDYAVSAEERRTWLTFWRGALSFSISRVGRNQDRDTHPYTGDLWVLNRAAMLLPQMTSDEQPEAFLKAILDLPPEASYWSVVFLRSFYRNALRADPVPASIASLRKSIVEYVLRDSVDADSRWAYHENAWLALIGVDELTCGFWEPRHRGLVEHGRPLLERWVSRAGTYGRHLGAFAAWLERDAADPVRLFGLVLLAGALSPGVVKRVYDHETAEDAVASLLNVTWKRDEPRLRKDTEAFGAFRRLLRWLADEQHSLALDLVGRIGGLS